ncbi:hypothetical protein ACJMK2_044102 [Sinanodonta woodiana]|uniref:Uncharacterized protein n=1 Tax=Sinanodonta woodiana TaxID=1069815 RepID=A0ABD3VYX5_SINWO
MLTVKSLCHWSLLVTSYSMTNNMVVKYSPDRTPVRRTNNDALRKQYLDVTVNSLETKITRQHEDNVYKVGDRMRGSLDMDKHTIISLANIRAHQDTMAKP